MTQKQRLIVLIPTLAAGITGVFLIAQGSNLAGVFFGLQTIGTIVLAGN